MLGFPGTYRLNATVPPGAPHGLFATHKDRFNADLLDFLRT